MPKNFKPFMGKGDLGATDLFGGRRVPKTDRRIKLNALLDELSALLGQAKAGMKDRGDKKGISAVQKDLLLACGVIAGMKADLAPAAAALAARIKTGAADVKPLKKFVLPGKNKLEALLHLARARTRICEILAWEIKARAAAAYLNRLSDYLFLEALKHARRRPSA